MLDGVPKQQEDRQSRHGGSNPTTSTGSSRTNSSAAGNSSDDLDVAGVGAGAAPSAGKASTAGRVDEAVSRAFTGEAWRTQLERAKPAAQSPTVLPEFEQVRAHYEKKVENLMQFTSRHAKPFIIRYPHLLGEGWIP